nr:MAG TPA: Protein of unknown function (DUF739) [Caudoviricetes sp.]
MEKLEYDYSKLNGRIVEKCGTQKNFASKMGLTERSVSLKLNNKRPFNQEDIDRSLRVLNIPPEEISVYYFTKKVQ